MTGPEHYREAEQILSLLDEKRDLDEWDLAVKNGDIAVAMTAAQVHATLALAAATALVREGVGGTLPAGDRAAWFNAASEHNTTRRKAAAA